MKIKNPQSGEYLDISSVRLTFIKEKNGHVSENVCVTIYYYGKKRPKRKDLPIPKDIDANGLDWIKEKGIAVYYRKSSYKPCSNENYDYTSKGVTISTNLGQRLEDLVLDVCFGNSDETEHIR